VNSEGTYQGIQLVASLLPILTQYPLRPLFCSSQLSFVEINNPNSPSTPGGKKKKKKKKINLTNTSRLKLKELEYRQRQLEEKLKGQIEIDGGKWTLFNGFVVKDSNVEEARDFKEDYREPCLISYRLIEDDQGEWFGDVGPGTPGQQHPRSGMSRREKSRHRATEQKMAAVKAR
jgi:hypothetical protein